VPTRDEHVFKTEGIVLRHADMGEADRLITLYTPFRGKVRAVAKGARKPTSKLAGHLEQFTYTSVLIARGRNLDLITQAQTVRTFIEVRESLRLVLYASYAVELVERATEWENENRLLFDVLGHFLSHLGAARRLETALRAFELEALDALGYRPQLDTCVACGRDLKVETNGFSSTAGGVLCPLCRGREGDQHDIAPETLAALQRLQHGRLAAAEHLSLSQEARTQAEALLAVYVANRLEHDLNSANILRALRKQITTIGPSIGTSTGSSVGSQGG
jgi:DNA repair protein RecO (recombination protein O)